MILKNKKKVCVVCHDSGGANLIAHYLFQFNYDIIFVLAGPAQDIFKKVFGEIKISSSFSELKKVDIVICGSGNTDWEWTGLILAKRIKKHVVVVFDHWTNYQNRLSRTKHRLKQLTRSFSILPNSLWVFDSHAKLLAQSKFPRIQVEIKPNFYLNTIVDEVQAYDNSIKKTKEVFNVLYLCQPIYNKWGLGREIEEFQALNYFKKKLKKIANYKITRITLRLHPSELEIKYEPWVEANKNLLIEFDQNFSLSNSISSSDLVVGCSSYAMVVALESGRKVYSSIPPWADEFRLPLKKIISL